MIVSVLQLNTTFYLSNR